MSCSNSTGKYILFVLIVLQSILSILIVLFGALGWGAMPAKYAITIIVLGAVLLLITCFGCFGAMRESPCLLWTYAVFMLVTIILYIVSLTMRNVNAFSSYALADLEESWKKHATEPEAMDTIQARFLCCGFNGPQDYLKTSTPASCCTNKDCENPLNLYFIGCEQKIKMDFADESNTTQYYTYGLLAINIVCLILSALLGIHYNNRNRRYNY